MQLIVFIAIVFTLSSVHISLTSSSKSATVDIDWNKVIRASKTTPTLQVVVNPPLRRESPISSSVFAALKNLNAEYVRYVPWLPYPKLAVAELEPPTKSPIIASRTSWNFTLIDPMLIDFMNAQTGRKVIINFSTIPQWMFVTKERVPYPDDPNQVDWSYEQGTQLFDPTMKELTDYYTRLVNWYVNGGFIDEFGRRHDSGYNFTFDYWEVLNEVEAEHSMTPQFYTQIYDAIVSAIRKVSPNTKFVGMALSNPRADTQWFTYFLNHSNHRAGITPDMISYHFYAGSQANETIDSLQYSLYSQADNFIAFIPTIESIRQRLSPDTRTTINEIGTMYENSSPIPEQYWYLSGGIYAYIFARLALLGIDIAGESQLIGYPTQFPSVSMVNWEIGAPNARFRVLQLLINQIKPGDKFVETSSSSDDIYALGFVNSEGEKKLLLINKRNYEINIGFQQKTDGFVYAIDVNTNHTVVAHHSNTDQLLIQPFAVQIIEFGK